MNDAVVKVRPYRPLDHRECRALWAQLAETDRKVLGDPSVGGADPGAAFEEYLTRLDLAGMWVAEHEQQGVVGLVGLLLGGAKAPGAASGGAGKGLAGAVEPIIVADRARGHGVGQALLDHVAAQGRRRGMRRLSVAPSPRNMDALHSLHSAGFRHLAAVTLTMSLSPGAESPDQELDLQGLRFGY